MDIAGHDRKFVVFLDKKVVRIPQVEMEVTVLAGEDADEVCADHLDSLIENEIDSGWSEVE